MGMRKSLNNGDSLNLQIVSSVSFHFNILARKARGRIDVKHIPAIRIRPHFLYRSQSVADYDAGGERIYCDPSAFDGDDDGVEPVHFARNTRAPNKCSWNPNNPFAGADSGPNGVVEAYTAPERLSTQLSSRLSCYCNHRWR